MTGDDVPAELLGRVVGHMDSVFHTKDVSQHADTQAALRAFVVDSQYHAVIGRRLSSASHSLGIFEAAKGGRRGSTWQKVRAGSSTTPVAVGGRRCEGRDSVGLARVRKGHCRSVEALAAASFAEIVALFDHYPEIGGTYFRPVERGLQPVNLDPLSPKPLIGVGPAFAATATATDLAPGMSARVAKLLAKRLAVSPSPEKRLEAGCVAGALRSGLRLDGLDPTWRLVSSQWRLDVRGAASLPDILAIDVAAGGLVAVELKARPDPSALPQVAAYVGCLERSPELLGLIDDLARAMARLYGCSDLPQRLASRTVRGYVAWPVGGRLVVHPA